MPEPRYRVLAIGSHPVQYMAPVLRRLAEHPRLDLSVAYCSLQGAQAAHDPEFNITVKWDVPLLDGYYWQEVPNCGSGAGSFWGLYNPGLWRLIRAGRFDAVLCYLSYTRASFWISYFASMLSDSAFLFGCDQHTLKPRSGGEWRARVKKRVWPVLYSLSDQVFVPSNAARSFVNSLGIPSENITLTPLAVDNDWWQKQAGMVDRGTIRGSWGADSETVVILFCAKLQPWKRPLDLLRAFAKANLAHCLLVFAGDGPQRHEVEREAKGLGIDGRVRFLGFVNQSQLPGVYASADLMVLPSEYEPFAAVVNEASCCSCPVVASDSVGAASDLVTPVDPKLVYSSGDIAALGNLLSELCNDRGRLRKLGCAAKQRMDTWSPADTASATVEAVEAALRRHTGHT